MAFEVTKMGKLADRLESEAYEWCVESIKAHFNLSPGENEFGYENDITEVLTEDHIARLRIILCVIGGVKRTILSSTHSSNLGV